MTQPTPIPIPTPAPPAPTPIQGVGLLARLRLSEPVRLYLYSLCLVLVAGLNLAGIITGQWQTWAISSAAVVLVVTPATEAARASVYSPTGAVRAINAAMTRTAA